MVSATRRTALRAPTHLPQHNQRHTRPHPAEARALPRHAARCAHFTCFTGTKLQILTQKALPEPPSTPGGGGAPAAVLASQEYAAFIFEEAAAAVSICTFVPVYYHKGTNSDAEILTQAAGTPDEDRSMVASMLRCESVGGSVLSLLALLVQKYRY